MIKYLIPIIFLVLAVPAYFNIFPLGIKHGWQFAYMPVPDSFLIGSEAKGLPERQFYVMHRCSLRYFGMPCEAWIRINDLVVFRYPGSNTNRLARINHLLGSGAYDATVLGEDTITTTTEKIYTSWIIARD